MSEFLSHVSPVYKITSHNNLYKSKFNNIVHYEKCLTELQKTFPLLCENFAVPEFSIGSKALEN